MLKIVHTADWHLGQLFFGYDRDTEHAAFLAWLVEYIRAEQPDAILVAGDVFDTVNPSAIATRRYYQFLADARAAAVDMQVVIVAGNHDAGARLEAPQDLLNTLNINVIGTVHRDVNGEINLDRFIIPVKNSHGEVEALVLAIPFLRPSDVPSIGQDADPYQEGIRELYRVVTERACQLRDELYPGALILGMGHLHLLGADECRDSERRLVIGGVEALNASSFPQEIAYVALGHLHKAQQFRDGTIRYSGSPIPLSFSEIHYQHQILQLKVEKEQPVEVTPVVVPLTKQLICVPERGYAPLDDILLQIGELRFDETIGEEHFPFLEVRVLEDKPDPTRRRKLEQAVEGKPVRLASIKVEYPDRDRDTNKEESQSAPLDLRSLDPERIFIAAYEEKYTARPDASVVAAFRETMLELSRDS